MGNFIADIDGANAGIGLLVLAGMIASLYLFYALERKQDQGIVQTVRAGAESVKGQVAVRMESRLRSFVRMARRWEFGGTPSEAAWEADAANYVQDLPEAQALEWIDAAGSVQWIAPVAGANTKLDPNLNQEESCRAAMREAERERQPVITHVVTLREGIPGFLVYAPIVAAGRFDGFIAAVFDARSSLNRFLPAAIADGEALDISEGGRALYERDTASLPGRAEWLVNEKVELNGTAWEIRVWPTPGLARRLDSPLPLIVLCAGVAGSLLLGAVCFLARLFACQAAETARANAALQSALEEVRTLEGLLPICSYCKRVRDDSGYWSQIDTYLRKHTNASLTHSYCPECAAKMYEEWGCDVPASVKADIKAGNYE